MKFFNTWDPAGIEPDDKSLKPYINLNPVLAPRTGGRNTVVRFWKSDTSVVERLMNKLMVPGHKGKKHVKSSGHNTGKAQNVYKIVYEAFKIIETQTKKNPLAVLVRAIENAAPREEIVSIEYGGARYPQPVEAAPQRRVDFALRQIAQGVYSKCFNSKKSAVQALADELIKASNMDITSSAVAKKLELERQTDAAR